MVPLVLTGLFLVGLPIALLTVFKSSAATMFFSTCVGLVVLSGADASLISTTASLLPVGEAEAYVRALLLVVFLVIGALLSKGTVRKSSGLLLHVLVVLFASLLLWSALPGLTGLSWLVDSSSQYAWDVVNSFQTVIATVGFIASLLLTRPKQKPHDKHK